MTTVAIIAEAFCKIVSESIVENYCYFFSECYIVFQRTEMTSTERTMGHRLISTCIVQTNTEKSRLSERVSDCLLSQRQLLRAHTQQVKLRRQEYTHNT